MDHQADLLRSFTAEGLLTAPGTHQGGNATHQDILSIDAKDLVHVVFSIFLGMTGHAHEHTYLLLEQCNNLIRHPGAANGGSSDLNVGEREVAALEQKGLPSGFRQRVGEAVAEVQSRRVVALAESPPSPAGRVGVV